MQRQLVGALTLAAIVVGVAFLALASTAVGMATEPWVGFAIASAFCAVALAVLVSSIRRMT